MQSTAFFYIYCNERTEMCHEFVFQVMLFKGGWEKEGEISRFFSFQTKILIGLFILSKGKK